jgi:IS5 family transposase
MMETSEWIPSALDNANILETTTDTEVIVKKRATGQSSFADFAVSGLGGPKTAALLERLGAALPWRDLVAPVLKLPEYARYIEDPSRPGERPIDPVVMLRCLMLAKWYNLSDAQLEEQLMDRISFRRFVGLSQLDRTPDETSFVRFRARLRDANLDQAIFDAILRHIKGQGLLVNQGSIVDATIIEQSTGRKTGEKDDDGNDLTTRDPEASFTKKNDTRYHGYKMHAATDLSGVITGVVVSTASHHDSQHIDELIVNETRAVFADSAYSDAARRERLEKRGVLPAIIYKRKRGQAKLSPWQKKWNRRVSKVRALGEHPFAWMKRLMNFTRCRYRGLRRNTFDFIVTAAAYNVRRAVSLAALAK